MKQFDWEDLLDDIEEENAILLLGDTSYANAGNSLQEQLKNKLGEEFLHSYEKSGLSLFSSSSAKAIAQKEANRYYKSLTPNEDFLRMIVEMPFPLIVSINPDNLIANAFSKYEVPYQFDYFSSRYKTHEYPLQRPDRNKPAIYNLCGSVEDRESLILDYDDLFDMLKTLLSDLKVPNEIRIPLLKKTTYIFIGFDFERWYTQLFMRYLNMNESRFLNNSSNYISKTSFSNSDSEKFFLHQFNVSYVGADDNFFYELYQKFKARYPHKMRELADMNSPSTTTIIQFVTNGNYLKAFQVLKEMKMLLDEEDQNLLIITEAEYASYELLSIEGTVSRENLNIMLARINKNLIGLAKKIK